MGAVNFSLLTTDAAALGRPLLAAARQVQRPTMGVIFHAGSQDRAAIAREVARRWPGVPTLIAHGQGVMTEQGEHEGQGAVAGLLASGLTVTPVWSDPDEEDAEDSLSERIEQAGGEGTLLLFLEQLPWASRVPKTLSRSFPRLAVVGGAGSEGPQGVVDQEGEFHQGAAVGLLIRRGGPRVALASGCRILGGWRTVTEAREGTILRVDEEPALEVLSKVARSVEGRPQLMALLPAPEGDPEQPGLRGSRVRPIRGVDPGRKAVMLGEAVAPGSRLAFAVLDGGAARQNLEAALREQARATAGAAASFGLYINCAGRGTSLYGVPHADSRLIKGKFPGVPVVGVMSSFEIAPSPGTATIHFYTGVFALFTAPS
ncbi:MAG: FIST C-terminal domain-containing protein [Myxococcales bacterium]|nr:FIST C-terminal domain-containing protein [Polyangiaceae bacterium]MDW8252016.1 FIST C-terminal domain-containing protein [Myxococcales bacterium]